MHISKPHGQVAGLSLAWIVSGVLFITMNFAPFQTEFGILGLLLILGGISVWIDARTAAWPLIILFGILGAADWFAFGFSASTLFVTINAAYSMYMVAQLNSKVVKDNEDEAHDVIRTPGDIIKLLALIVLPASFLQFVSFESIANWWFCIGMSVAVFLIWGQFIRDNSRTRFTGQINSNVVISAAIAWTPVILLLIPGIVIAISFEVLLHETIQYLELKTNQFHSQSDSQLDQIILDLENAEYSMWWPPDLIRERFDGWQLQMARAGETINHSSDGLSRILFSCLYTALRCLQILSVTILVLIVGRSFIHVLFRTWLRQGSGVIRFRLADMAVKPNTLGEEPSLV